MMKKKFFLGMGMVFGGSGIYMVWKRGLQS